MATVHLVRFSLSLYSLIFHNLDEFGDLCKDEKSSKLIRDLLDSKQLTVQEGVELEQLLDSPDQRPKHTRVENWLNQSMGEGVNFYNR